MMHASKVRPAETRNESLIVQTFEEEMFCYEVSHLKLYLGNLFKRLRQPPAYRLSGHIQD